MTEYHLGDYDLYADDYDHHYGSHKTDVPFYVEEAKRAGGQALELACGTGRVLIPVAEAGVQVMGLDGSPGMLEKLRDKLQTLPVDVRARIRVLKGDMRSFDLGRQFALVYVPARSFLHLMTVDDQKAALGCIHRHLQDGGRLALNFFNPSLSLINEAAGRWRPFVEGREFVNERGNRVMVWNTRHYDTVNQVIEQYTIYDEIDEGGRVVDRRYMPLTLRWIYRFEFEHLLSTCGFAVEALYGTFDREPFTNERQELVWVARKA